MLIICGTWANYKQTIHNFVSWTTDRNVVRTQMGVNDIFSIDVYLVTSVVLLGDFCSPLIKLLMIKYPLILSIKYP